MTHAYVLCCFEISRVNAGCLKIESGMKCTSPNGSCASCKGPGPCIAGVRTLWFAGRCCAAVWLPFWPLRRMPGFATSGRSRSRLSRRRQPEQPPSSISEASASLCISAAPSDSVAPQVSPGKSLLRMRCFAERLRKGREAADFTTQYQARLTPLRNRYRNPHRLAARQRTSAANLLPKMDRLPISSFTVGIVVPI
jgi:hypothetical protein